MNRIIFVLIIGAVVIFMFVRDPDGESVAEADTQVNTEVDTRAIESVDSAATTTSSSAPESAVTGYVDNLHNAMQSAEDVQKILDERDAKLQNALNNTQ